MQDDQQILISQTPGETRVAICVAGEVQQLRAQRADPDSKSDMQVGDIYRGRIARVVPGMQAAFVELGAKRNGFLPRANVAELKASQPLEQQLHEGQNLLLQVQRTPRGDKGALLSSELGLAGRRLVFKPFGTGVALAHSITDPHERTRLQEIIESLSLVEGGLIVRSAAVTANAAALARELQWLIAQWHSVCGAEQSDPVPQKLYTSLDLLQSTICEADPDVVSEVIIDQPDAVAKAQRLATLLAPELRDKIRLHAGTESLFAAHRIDDVFELALERQVDLPNGGVLVIDQNEAMSTIDVNSAANLGRRDQQQTIVQTNLDAVAEIVRQLQLRNIGGLVVIDFIDMRSPANRQQLEQALGSALAGDPRCAKPGKLSSLGLVEFARRYDGPSLLEVLCEPCQSCGGSGRVKNVRSVCYDILRELEASEQTFSASRYTVIAAPEVIDLFAAQFLSRVQSSIASPVTLQADQEHTRHYEIALGQA